jgi:flagellar hook assembly protein FlgD
LLACCNSLYGLTANDIIAYPVPFNPNQNTLIIGTKVSGLSLAGYSVNVSIYDINGDFIIKKTASGNIKWNGRNNNGRIVKPGLYILKVEIENYSTDPTDSGKSDYIKKIIRILIDY